MICWKIQDTTTNGPLSLQLKYKHLTPRSNQQLNFQNKVTVQPPCGGKSVSGSISTRFLFETKSTNIYSRLNGYNFAFREA